MAMHFVDNNYIGGSVVVVAKYVVSSIENVEQKINESHGVDQ